MSNKIDNMFEDDNNDYNELRIDKNNMKLNKTNNKISTNKKNYFGGIDADIDSSYPNQFNEI